MADLGFLEVIILLKLIYQSQLASLRGTKQLTYPAIHNTSLFTDNYLFCKLIKSQSMIQATSDLISDLKDGKWGFINKKGEVVIPYQYDDNDKWLGNLHYDFSEGLATVCINDKWGCINERGYNITPHIYDSPIHFKNGLAVVRIEWKFGYIDRVGNEVIPVLYDHASDFTGRFAKVQKDKKAGLIDINGREITPIKYDWIGKDEIIFHEGLAPVMLNEKCGYINDFGHEVIPCIYDDAFIFQSDLLGARANVVLNGERISINKKGRKGLF